MTLTRMSAIAALGPISGPMVLAMLSCIRSGRYFMAGVYAVGIVEAWAGLAVVERLMLGGMK